MTKYSPTKCRTGNGRISASGGNGFAGGGGGRVSINVFSRHDDLKFFVHGKTVNSLRKTLYLMECIRGMLH